LLDPDNEYSLFSYVQITFFRGISSEPSSDWLLRDDATFTEAQIGITQLELGVIKISDFNIDYQTNEMDADTLIKYIGNKEENAHLLTGDATNNDTVNLFDANPLTGFWSATTPTPTASGTYNQSTGEIVLSLNDISYFHLEGPAGIFNGSAPNLSAFTNDISIDNNNNIGAFTKSSWNVSNQSIGNVAATSYNPTDLYLVFNYKGSGEREGIKIPLDGTIYTANKKVSYSDANITITPNPAHDIIYIQSDLNEIIEIAIYTITGTQVLTLKTTLNKQIDISNLSPGVYNISITSDKVNETQKLIVK